MSTLNKVLLVLVLLCAAGLVYLGADALKMRRESQKKLAEAEKSLQDEQEKNRQYLYGTGQDDGYVFLVNDVNRMLKARGIRSWPNCMPHSKAVVNGRTLTLQLVVDATPEPVVAADQLVDLADDTATPPDAGSPDVVTASNIPAEKRILPGTTVYLFDKRPIEEGGCLLGEFVVDKVQDDIATLKNVYLMTKEEEQRINDSVAKLAPWGVYTTLPGAIPTNGALVAAEDSAAPAESTDSADSTEPAETDESTLAADEADAVPADDETLPVELAETETGTERDSRAALGQTFVSLNIKRMHLQKYVDIYQQQGKSLVDTDTLTNKELVSFYQSEIEKTQELQSQIERHLAAVEKLHTETTAEVERLKEFIANIKAMNKKMLAELTKAQMLAAEKINERDASLSMTP